MIFPTDKDGIDMEARMLSSFPDAAGTKDQHGVYHLLNDDIVLKFAPYTGIHLNVTDLELSNRYYQKLGMSPDFSVEESSEHRYLKFNDFDYFTLVLSQTEKISRGEAFGRMAFSCADHDI